MPCCVSDADAASSVFASAAGSAGSAGSTGSAGSVAALLVICGSTTCLVLLLSAVLLPCRFSA